MAALQHAKASNERIASTFPKGLVAVFVGGTSGVGECTLKTFTRHASNPRVYLVGRSQEAANRIVAECQSLNPNGYFEFIKADISALKNVDDVCRQLKAKESAINLLFQSQGSMGFDAGKFPFTMSSHKVLMSNNINRNPRRNPLSLRSRHALPHPLHPEPPPRTPKSPISPPRRQCSRRNL